MKKVLIVTFLLLLVLISCKQKDSGLNKATNINAINPNATDTYRSTVLTIPDESFGMNVQNNLFIVGDRIHIKGYINNENATYSCDWNGGDFRLETSGSSPEGQEFNLSDGSKIVFKWVWQNNFFETMLIQKYSDKNKLVFELDVDSVFNVDLKSQMTDYALISGDTFQIVNAVQTSDGTIYIAGQKKLVALDENGVKLFDIQISGEVTNLTVLTDDSVIVKYGDTRGNVYIKYVDFAAHKLGDEIVLPDTVNMQSSQIVLGPGYDLYIKNPEGLFGFNIGGEPILVIDWHKSNTIATGMNDLLILTTEKYMYYSYNYLSYSIELVMLDMIPKNELKERTPIKLAKLCHNFLLDYYVLYFNRENPEYRIEIIDYFKYNTQDNPDAGVNIFNAEIAAGNIPDLMMWEGGYTGFPIESYKEKDLLRDLYGLMGKDKDFLMPFAYKPFEEDGKLFQFSTYITFEAYVGKKALFPKTPMTPGEMIKYYNSLNADQFLVQSSMYGLLIQERTVTDFVDNVNHKVYFDSEEFIEIIRCIKENTGKVPPDPDPDDRNAQFRNDTVQLYRTGFNTFENLLEIKNVFEEEIAFVGFPTLSDNGAIVRANIAYGITNKSQNAEMAWQFLKRMLADDIQYPEGSIYAPVYYMPLTISAFNRYVDNMLKRTYIFYDDRSRTWYERPLPEEHRPGKYVELTRGEIDALIDYITNAKTYNVTDYQFLRWQIIFEEMQYDKPPEEIAKVIQSRAFIYINERR